VEYGIIVGFNVPLDTLLVISETIDSGESLTFNVAVMGSLRRNIAMTFGMETRSQSNLTKSASWGAHCPVRGHPRGSKFVPLNSWGRVSY